MLLVLIYLSIGNLQRRLSFFGFDYNIGEDVFRGLKERVEILTEVLQSCDVYKCIVTDSHKSLLPEHLFYVRNKCLYLCTACNIAGGDANTWLNTCCQEVVGVLAGLGFDTTFDRKRISYQNIEFCKENYFPHPNPYAANGIKPTPSFNEYFPKATTRCKYFYP
jgi:hypothetical protein